MQDRRVDPPSRCQGARRRRIETAVTPGGVRVTGIDRHGSVSQNISLTHGEFDTVVDVLIRKGAGTQLRERLRLGDQAIQREAMVEKGAKGPIPTVAKPVSTRKKAKTEKKGEGDGHQPDRRGAKAGAHADESGVTSGSPNPPPTTSPNPADTSAATEAEESPADEG